MNVFIDATGITPVTTGLGKYSLNLLTKLTVNGDVRYTILCLQTLPVSHDLFRLKRSNINFLKRTIPVIGPRRDVSYHFIKRAIAQCDIYHCLSSYMPFFGVPIPSVVTIHDLKYVRYPEFLSNYLKSWYLKKIITNTLKNASRLIAVSESTKSDLISLGVDESKVTVIHEASTIDVSSIDSMKENNNSTLKDYLLYVGENRPHKNLERLLIAYNNFAKVNGKNCPNLILAGYGTEALGVEINRMGLTDKVMVFGPVCDRTLLNLYRNALAFLFPTLYEGFGLPVLEAMSLGVPVLTSDITSTKEIAGNAAHLVDPASVLDIQRGIEKITGDSTYRHHLIQAGYQRASQFSWSKAAQETLFVYRALT